MSTNTIGGNIMKKHKQKDMISMMIVIILVVICIICKHLKVQNKEIKNELDSIETNSQLEMEILAYRHAELSFLRLTAEEVNDKIENGDHFFLYTGRITCQYCRKIVPILNKVIKDNNIELYYLDSENTKEDIILSNFRDTYGIKTVPSIIYFIGKDDYHTFELNMSEDDESEIEKSLMQQLTMLLEAK